MFLNIQKQFNKTFKQFSQTILILKTESSFSNVNMFFGYCYKDDFCNFFLLNFSINFYFSDTYWNFCMRLIINIFFTFLFFIRDNILIWKIMFSLCSNFRNHNSHNNNNKIIFGISSINKSNIVYICCNISVKLLLNLLIVNSIRFSFFLSSVSSVWQP